MSLLMMFRRSATGTPPDNAPVSPAAPLPVVQTGAAGTPIAGKHAVVTITTPAALLTACAGWVALDALANFVIIDVETDAIRLTLDGTVPTAALGYKFEAGFKGIILNRAEIAAAKVIRVTTDAVLQVSQFI